MGREQRKHPRVDISFPAEVTLHGKKKTIEATVINISEGGAFLQVEEPFKRGDLLQLRVFLDTEELQVNTEAEVVYESEEDTYDENTISTVEGMETWVKRGGVRGIGVKFLTLSREERQFLKNVLQAVD